MKHCIAFLLVLAAAVSPAVVKGTFIVNGKDAGLRYVRARRDVLDEKGRHGYSVLLSARPATDDIRLWKTAEPSERGSFMYVQLEEKGPVWVAELGHEAAKSGRFGVVTELTADQFKVANGRLSAHLHTIGEQEFSADRYAVDVTIDVPLEEK